MDANQHHPSPFPYLQIGLFLLSLLTGWVSGVESLFKAAYIFLAPIVQVVSLVSFMLGILLTLKNLKKKE